MGADVEREITVPLHDILVTRQILGAIALGQPVDKFMDDARALVSEYDQLMQPLVNDDMLEP